MKKYRLIREYPGSPKLGTILTHEELQFCNWNEYYQEVIEKDYEILSFTDLFSKDIMKKHQNNNFGIIWGEYTEKDQLDKLSQGKKIHSVKRNDGEIFTIGDKVVGYNNSIAKIKTIDLVGEISLNIGTDKSEGFSLKNLKKVKQPLFTTEDGVDIFEGDNLYSIDNMLNIKKHLLFNARYDDNTLLNNRIFFNSDYKHFSTKEKAEEYILYNKPLLTLKDIDELLCKNTSSYFLEKFKKRAQKLNNKN